MSFAISSRTIQSKYFLFVVRIRQRQKFPFQVPRISSEQNGTIINSAHPDYGSSLFTFHFEIGFSLFCSSHLCVLYCVTVRLCEEMERSRQNLFHFIKTMYINVKSTFWTWKYPQTVSVPSLGFLDFPSHQFLPHFPP